MAASQPPSDSNETNWIVQVNEKVGRMRSKSDEERYWENHSIYRVPACIANLNKKAYWPQAVSFGPYHHGEDQLLPMEDHKHRALHHFLWRSRMRVEPFLESLSAVVGDLQNSYDSLDPKWKEGTGEGAVCPFLELMITDGCFMLEILRTMTGEVRDYASNDPIFGDLGLSYIAPYIMRDMLMLENQLPMLVLNRLVAVESGGEQDDESINRLILRFYSPDRPIKRMGECLHVLDVYRKSLLLPENLDKERREEKEEMIRSATELEEAGIRLETSNTSSLKDISFAGGVLRLPVIVVEDITESMFLNVMTFERFHCWAVDEVMAYVFFMDDLINAERDVTLLSTHGIIKNFIGSDKAVAELFNSLSKDMPSIAPNSLNCVRKEVKEYCEKRWNKWRANLIHTYFRNPWSILSLIAAIFLFILTIIQTIYTVSPNG